MQGIIDRFIDDRVRAGVFTGDTPKSYQGVLRLFADATLQPLAAVTRSDVVDFLDSRTGKKSSRGWRVAVLSSFFDWCVGEGLIDRSPVAGLKGPRTSHLEKAPRFLERDEVAAVLAKAKTARDRVIICLGVQVGLRRKEIHALDLSDVDWQAGIIRVRGKGYDGDISRIVPITTELRAALRTYLAESPPFTGDGEPQPVVRNYLGRRLAKTTMSTIVSEAMTAAGVKHEPWDGKSLHGLRHTTVQHLLDDGADIRLVQQLVGHASVTTTENYARRRAANELLLRLAERRSYGA